MAVRTVQLLWVGVVVVSVAVSAVAQPPADGQGPPKTPAQIFRAARDLIQDGRFDVAADTLKTFLEAAKDDKDYLAIMEREPTVFQKLRGIPVWSEDPKAQAEALKTVDAIIKRSEQAVRAIYRNPERIRKFVNNLGATLEERIYAEDQLVKAGDAAVPVMVETLRVSSDVPTRSGIYNSLTKLSPEVIPGFLAALDGLPDEAKIGILRGLINRQDVLSLFSTAETDFTGHLWYFASTPGDQSLELRSFAKSVLERLGANPSRRRSEEELTNLAKPFTNKTARYRFSDRVKIWHWDGTKPIPLDANREQADDYYGIRLLKWANERNPSYLPAQELFLAFSIQRAVEKAKFGELATSDPALYQVVASAPSATLINLLDQALRTQKTALALGLVQVLGARADRVAVTGLTTNSPGVLVQALDHADARVQLAAAVAILRSSVTTHGKNARIVDILQKAVRADTGDGVTPEMGRALISDPLTVRASRVASYLQQMGYATERYATGQELLRRAARASDYDLVILDRHTTSPELKDVLAQLRPDRSAARMPILVLASSNKVKPLTLESLMLRLAKLIAVTETANIQVPTPFTFDPAKATPDLDLARRQANRVRDFQLAELFKIRSERMMRIVSAVGLPNDPALVDRVKIRSAQLTYAVLSAEYGLSATSAPDTFARYQLLNEQIANKKELHTALENLPLDQLSKIVEQLDGALDEPRRKEFDALTTRTLTDHLHLPEDQIRDLDLEEQLSRQLRTFPAVTVIPEPYSLTGFSDDVRHAAADPAQLPRDLNEKKASALLAANWLRKLALGEVPGYDITPAEPALRAALRNDTLADPAIDALAKIPSALVQQDLTATALTVTRPVPIRLKAADRAIQHAQSFGKLLPKNVLDALQKGAEAEANVELKAKLLVLNNLLNAKPGALGQQINSYAVPLPQAPKAAAPAGAADPMPKEGENKNSSPPE